MAIHVWKDSIRKYMNYLFGPRNATLTVCQIFGMLLLFFAFLIPFSLSISFAYPNKKQLKEANSFGVDYTSFMICCLWILLGLFTLILYISTVRMQFGFILRFVLFFMYNIICFILLIISFIGYLVKNYASTGTIISLVICLIQYGFVHWLYLITGCFVRKSKAKDGYQIINDSVNSNSDSSSRWSVYSCVFGYFGFVATFILSILSIGLLFMFTFEIISSTIGMRYFTPSRKYKIASYTDQSYWYKQSTDYSTHGPSWKMHIHCTGRRVRHSDPIILLQHGEYASGVSLIGLQRLLQSSYYVCTADRSGYGHSDAGPLPRNIAQSVAELHELYQTVELRPPFVLIGYGVGGVISRFYCFKYPKQCAGIVTLDSHHSLWHTYLFQYVESISEKQAWRLSQDYLQNRVKLLDIYRFASNFGLLRILLKFPVFHPKDREAELKELSYEPKLWNSLYMEYYGLIFTRDFQTDIMNSTYSNFNSTNQKEYGTVLGKLPLLVVSNDKNYKTCNELHLQGEECRAFQRKQKAIRIMDRQILGSSKQSQLVLCKGCTSTMPWENATFCENLIDDFITTNVSQYLTAN